MSENFDIQVKKEHYSGRYDSLLRFISYYYQIDIIRKLNPQSILEIGVGNKTFSNYLKQNGFNIKTCDFDKSLKPDVVADIRKLPFKDNQFDCITAFEILEHLPWEDIDKTLIELNRMSKKYVLISIPYYSKSIEIIFKFPMVGKLIKKPFADFFIRIPTPFNELKFNGQHYWEMGRKNYPKRKIRQKLNQYFIIIDEIRPIINHNHYFFVLEKK